MAMREPVVLSGDVPLLTGGGELGRLMREKDWSASPLGLPTTWSPTVRTAVSLCLNSRFPILLWIGPELRILYNDAYAPFLGERKHPAMLGAPGHEAWVEIWDSIGPLLDEAMRGNASWREDFQFFFTRDLPDEEVYVTFSYSPILSADGGSVEGVFCVCTETTTRVLGQRRLSTLRDLGVRRLQPDTPSGACEHAVKVLEANSLDIAFAGIYLIELDTKTARLIARTQLPAESHPAFPVDHGLMADDGPWPFAQVLRTGCLAQIDDLPNSLGSVQAPLWPDLVRRAVVLPVLAPGQAKAAGFLVVAVSPRRLLDADCQSFLELVADHVGSSIAEARVLEEERRRSEALAELDQAKTAFFSNVSHEFRTPLTLMLGPLKELLAKPVQELSKDGRALATVAHRNGVRLLRLVNALLDFSRLEAGRADASYVPTDLSRLTAELASSFESACARAGLRLEIACPPLRQPVYVDRDMWEKIVLNLMSNAFKFTLEGGIAVRITERDDGAELVVADTGVGIDRADVPRLFERFHRIKGQKSRSHEGSGIGLALVKELVALHGGRITVDSQPGEGTTLKVSVPYGTSHLPPDRIGAPRPASTPSRASAFIEEALRWLPTESGLDGIHNSSLEPAPVSASEGSGARILVADDNSDMRDYLARLLRAQGWLVECVADGVAALATARLHRPDFVVSDVMMPSLGGLALVAAMRSDPALSSVPIMLLSARAGEDTQVQGLATGADDYLIKPFGARELVARVSTHLKLARLRAEASERVRQSEARLQAAIDLVGLCPYSWDPPTGRLDWDDRLRAIWGLQAGAPVSKDIFLSGIAPEDRPRVEAAIERCLDPASGGIYALEYRVIGIGTGEQRWVATYGQTQFCEGVPVGFIGAALDITDRKKSEERLRSSEERFRLFAKHSPNVLWVLDVSEMRLEYISPAYNRVWGRGLSSGPGTALDRWLNSVHADDREHAAESLDRAVAGEVVTVEYRILRPDSEIRWIRDTSFPIPDASGRIVRVGGIALDLTRHDGRLVYAVDGLDADRKMVSDVLENAGYEVKSFPSIQTFLQMAPVLVPGCVVLDVRGSGGNGSAVVRDLNARRISLPVVVMGEGGDVDAAVQVMKAGAVDWLDAGCDPATLRAAVASALAGIRETEERNRLVADVQARIASMSSREREVLTGMMVGDTNKTIGRRLGISPRTVEIHRAHVMKLLGARTLSEAILLASAARPTNEQE